MSNQVFTGVPLGWAFKINGSVQAYKGVGAVIEIDLGGMLKEKLQFIAVVKNPEELAALRNLYGNTDTKFWPLAVCHGDQVEWNEDRSLGVPPPAPAPTSAPAVQEEEDW